MYPNTILQVDPLVISTLLCMIEFPENISPNRRQYTNPIPLFRRVFLSNRIAPPFPQRSPRWSSRARRGGRNLSSRPARHSLRRRCGDPQELRTQPWPSEGAGILPTPSPPPPPPSHSPPKQLTPPPPPPP